MKEKKNLPETYFLDTNETWWLQLVPPKTETDPTPFVGKPAIVET